MWGGSPDPVVGQIPAHRDKSRRTGANPADRAAVLGQIPASLTYSILNKILLGSSGRLIRVHFVPDFVGAGIGTKSVRFALVMLPRDRDDDDGGTDDDDYDDDDVDGDGGDNYLDDDCDVGDGNEVGNDDDNDVYDDDRGDDVVGGAAAAAPQPPPPAPPAVPAAAAAAAGSTDFGRLEFH